LQELMDQVPSKYLFLCDNEAGEQAYCSHICVIISEVSIQILFILFQNIHKVCNKSRGITDINLHMSYLMLESISPPQRMRRKY
jgi:hypothetical protein